MIAEPIGDDELQRLRELWNYLRGFDADYRVSERVGPLLRLLARLDAAESRAAEMQREVERDVERLSGFLEMRQIIC